MFEEIPNFIKDYLPILIFFGIAIGLSVFIMLIPYLVAVRRPDSEKLSQYECGFTPFFDARRKFDIKFYLIAILYIIFDLEITFLFPWAITLGNIGYFGFWSMMLFLAILTIGFIYEWKKGALD